MLCLLAVSLQQWTDKATWQLGSLPHHRFVIKPVYKAKYTIAYSLLSLNFQLAFLTL